VAHLKELGHTAQTATAVPGPRRGIMIAGRAAGSTVAYRVQPYQQNGV